MTRADNVNTHANEDTIQMNSRTLTALNTAANALAEATADAYSWDNYGEKGWRAACLMLLKRGYSPKSAEAILRSKWTRWAADMASDRKSWRYGRTNGADLARFLDTMPADQRASEVEALVLGTFGYLDLPVDVTGDETETA